MPSLTTRVESAAIRLLTPFTCTPLRTDGGRDALVAAFATPTFSPAAVPVWHRVGFAAGALEPHPLYLDELLPSVRDSLFGDSLGSCVAFRASPHFIERAFTNPRAFPEAGTGASGGPAVPAATVVDGVRRMRGRLTQRTTDGADPGRVASDSIGVYTRGGPIAAGLLLGNRPGVELWVSPMGAGVLSITVELDALPADLDLLRVQHLCYLLSQRNERRPVLTFGRYERTPPLAALASALERPLAERLGVAGEPFTVPELADWLLAPLNAAAADARDRLRVYSVLRLGIGDGFAESPAREEYGRVLAGLAQVEEQHHPGAAGLAVPTATLNRHVMAAVSQLGAARLMMDQRFDDQARSEFNPQRFERGRDRAFMPYLVAILQRLTLERLRDEVAAKVRDTRDEGIESVHDATTTVRRDLLEFSASLYVSDVSTRDEYNRYFRVAQDGLRVRDAYDTLARTVSELDRTCQGDRQLSVATGSRTIAQQMGTTMENIANFARESHMMEERLAGLEVFLIGFYAMYAVHVLGESFEFNHLVRGWTALGFSLLAIIYTARVLGFVGRRGARDHATTGARPPWAPVAVMAVLLMGYLVLGFAMPRAHGGSPAPHAGTPTGASAPSTPATAPAARHETATPGAADGTDANGTDARPTGAKAADFVGGRTPPPHTESAPR